LVYNITIVDSFNIYGRQSGMDTHSSQRFWQKSTRGARNSLSDAENSKLNIFRGLRGIELPVNSHLRTAMLTHAENH